MYASLREVPGRGDTITVRSFVFASVPSVRKKETGIEQKHGKATYLESVPADLNRPIQMTTKGCLIIDSLIESDKCQSLITDHEEKYSDHEELGSTKGFEFEVRGI